MIEKKTKHVFINVTLYHYIVYYIIVILVHVVTDHHGRRMEVPNASAVTCNRYVFAYIIYTQFFLRF